MRRVIRKRDEKDRKYHKWGAEEKLRIRALAGQLISLEGTAKDFGVSASVCLARLIISTGFYNLIKGLN